MALGVILPIIGAVVGYAVIKVWSDHVYQQGYRAGMVDEAKAWFNAVEKIQPPNWQSLPDPEGTKGEESVASRKEYVDNFKRALTSVKLEVAINRMQALADDIIKAYNGDESEETN